MPILLWTSASFAICLDSYSLSPPRRGVPGLGLGATRAWWSPGPAALGCLCMLQAALVTYCYTTNAKVSMIRMSTQKLNLEAALERSVELLTPNGERLHPGLNRCTPCSLAVS